MIVDKQERLCVFVADRVTVAGFKVHTDTLSASLCNRSHGTESASLGNSELW